MIGRRIVIYGARGSGKSTVARRLGAALGLGVVDMDALMHGPNWEPRPGDDSRRKVLEAIGRSPEGWVCDGNYGSVRDAILAQAHTVIWLRLPFRVVFWRLLKRTLRDARHLLKRTVRRAWTRELLWATTRESWRQSFLSHGSLLWSAITQRKASAERVRHDLATIPHSARIIELRSAREVEELLASLEASKATGDPAT